MALRVTLIQGGGSGLDQVPAVQEVIRAAGVAIDWDEHPAGWASLVSANCSFCWTNSSWATWSSSTTVWNC